MRDGQMDLRERCRLCIEPRRLSIDIFSEEGRRIKLKSKINKHLSLKVSQSDGLPNQICYQCLYRLETWVSFKQLCIERDQAMKTWSQSFLEEASPEVDGKFNQEQNQCKSENIREHDASTSSRFVPSVRETELQNKNFSSGNEVDNASSDTSLWKVVKVAETGVLEFKRQVKASPQRRSPLESFTCAEDDIDQRSEWKRRKVRKPSKVPSSGSDTSVEIDITSTNFTPQALDHVTSSSLTSSCPQSSVSQVSLSTDTSFPPIKRKRGRPSKASLQKERELKKLKDQETINGMVCDASEKNLLVDVVGDPDSKEDVSRDIDETADVEVTLDMSTAAVSPEFVPISRDDGSGVTEVVLDDPDFGSMKFTLSVVRMESPISSPIHNEDYKYYPESCASSCGNISLDSHNREDFEGFESPNIFLRPKLSDSTMNSNMVSEEVPRSRSQADVRLSDNEEFLPAGVKRKRSISASGGFRGNFSASSTFSEHFDDHSGCDFLGSETGEHKIHCLSKSSENIKADSCMQEEYCSDSLEDRNAYSDGEIIVTPTKSPRQKPRFSIDL